MRSKRHDHEARVSLETSGWARCKVASFGHTAPWACCVDKTTSPRMGISLGTQLGHAIYAPPDRGRQRDRYQLRDEPDGMVSLSSKTTVVNTVV